jgi:hypothetical protein
MNNTVIKLTPRSRIVIEAPGKLSKKRIEWIREEMLRWMRDGSVPVLLTEGLTIKVLELPADDEALEACIKASGVSR